MGLIKETNAAYYSGQVVLKTTSPTVFTFGNTTTSGSGFNTPLVGAFEWDPNTSLPVQIASASNYTLINLTTGVTIPENASGVANVKTNEVVIFPDPNAPVYATAGDFILCQLKENAIEQNYGGYEYVSLTDIVNNFMVAYVGMDKLIPRCKRSDIIFHAKRGLQEFSYDTLKSVNSQELTIPPSLSVPIPQDYVNYVQLSYVDDSGIKHIIYPTRLTSNPTDLPIQDAAGIPTQNSFAENNQANQSITEKRWSRNNNLNITGQLTIDQIDNYVSVYGFDWFKLFLGRRYGLEPEVSQTNGWFTINEREGKFSFSSGLVGQLIILEYISDGLAYDMDTKVPKMAEDALYAHISHAVLASRSNVQEYIVQRYKKERYAKLRNAKIRLSNIKLEEFTQVMRGKSKWIKH